MNHPLANRAPNRLGSPPTRGADLSLRPFTKATCALLGCVLLGLVSLAIRSSAIRWSATTTESAVNLPDPVSRGARRLPPRFIEDPRPD